MQLVEHVGDWVACGVSNGGHCREHLYQMSEENKRE